MVETSEALKVLVRWAHITSGIFWIGLLYYFNVVQVPVFKRFDGATRSNAIQKLVPVALAWFRYTALFTVVFGLLLLYLQDQTSGDFLLKTTPGVSILSGMILGLIMAFNVWAIIWPNQRKIIQANREKAATGKEIPSESALWAKRAFYASRFNFIVSFPMLFFMAGTSHGQGFDSPTEVLWAGAIVLVVAGAALWFFTKVWPSMKSQPTAGTTPTAKP